MYLLFALGTAHMLLLSGVEAQHALAYRQELRLVNRQIASLRNEVGAIRQELQHADDPAYLEKKARALGYVYPDEVLHAAPR